ncbi:hypothetical protein BZA05DRAFT_175469 [Tricharina praecox]|uniref:uncharacterized protein n=1 Tax=Tricharina praecox TaxID=43433 RepID=UPI00221EC5EC|nr:uncharacterized protein BZA05DRAFT_175469 [Tricharina praecox]KAI5844100.1 hypothetical protein BZA05DRAFT_175469 [Tricharina praecox]
MFSRIPTCSDSGARIPHSIARANPACQPVMRPDHTANAKETKCTHAVDCIPYRIAICVSRARSRGPPIIGVRVANGSLRGEGLAALWYRFSLRVRERQPAWGFFFWEIAAGLRNLWKLWKMAVQEAGLEPTVLWTFSDCWASVRRPSVPLRADYTSKQLPWVPWYSTATVPSDAERSSWGIITSFFPFFSRVISAIPTYLHGPPSIYMGPPPTSALQTCSALRSPS